MRVVGRLILWAVVLVGVFYFVGKWHKTTSWGYGTGYYGGKSDSANQITPPSSRLETAAKDPAKYVGKKITLTGRVFQPAHYASNRNIYTLVASDNESRILIIDDKAPPQEYYTRTVTGVLKRVPSTDHLYLVDVKSGIKIDTPTWAQVKNFFDAKYDETRSVVGKTLKNVGNEIG